MSLVDEILDKEEDKKSGAIDEGEKVVIEKVSLGQAGADFFKKRNSIEEVEDKEYHEEDSNKDGDFLKENIEDGKFNIEEKESISKDDLCQISSFAIEAIDTGVSMLSGAIAGEDSSNYCVPDNKKEKLSNMLSSILEKYSIKLSLEMMFIFSLVLVFSSPVSKAVKNKKKRKSKKTIVKNKSGRPKKVIEKDSSVIEKSTEKTKDALIKEEPDNKNERETKLIDSEVIEVVEAETVEESERNSFKNVNRGFFDND